MQTNKFGYRIMAPRSSITILNSLYSQFDFLPPSQPPLDNETSKEQDKVVEEDGKKGGAGKGGARLMKRHKSVEALGGGRPKTRQETPQSTNGNGYHNFNTHEKPKRRASTNGLLLSRQEQFGAAGKDQQIVKEGEKKKFNDWSAVKIVEQYDEKDLTTTSQPWAYVADYIVEVGLSKGLTEEMKKYDAWKIEEEGGIPSPESGGETPGATESRSPRLSTGFGLGEGIQSPTFSARERRRKSRRAGWFEKLRDGLQKGEEIGWFIVYVGDEERGFRPLSAGPEAVEKREEEHTHVKVPRSTGFRGFFTRRGKAHGSD